MILCLDKWAHYKDYDNHKGNYANFEQVVSTGTAGYVAYYAANGAIASVSGMAITASTPVVMGAVVLSGISMLTSVNSTYEISKLATDTFFRMYMMQNFVQSIDLDNDNLDTLNINDTEIVILEYQDDQVYMY
ncbi:MAG: hypothetical protein ACI8ZF_000984 [Candidatus Midichloriaceae bacterium]